MMRSYLEYSTEVENALKNKSPVLALESTIITHGMAFPHNLETAVAVEKIAREQGVTPATIAIFNGKIRIGLSENELSELAQNTQVVKASKRDIPAILAAGQCAGTTVAATLFCAQMAGIRVFATGGIGGVHHGNSMDISADLIELSRTPVAVVCAGAKAILDLPRTLEFLEMMSIPVIGYGTSTLPAFYTATTPYPLHCRADDVKTLAKILKTHWELGMKSGILIANPISANDEIPASLIEPVIENALQSAAEKHISGKSVTPFLLSEIAAVTKGKSLAANISLIKNNVRLGAQLAAAIQ